MKLQLQTHCIWDIPEIQEQQQFPKVSLVALLSVP
jgi:hypothetical protein